MKKVLFMLSSMNIGGVEKSLLSLLSVLPKEKYTITIVLLEKKGDFLESLPDWVRVDEAKWFKEIKPIIMQPPQTTVLTYLKDRKFSRIIPFIYSYVMSEKILKSRYFYYKSIFESIPECDGEFDIAISYQGPTDIIDFYIANKVNAKKKISWVHFDVSKHFINEKLYKKLYEKFNKIYVVSNNAKKVLLKKIPNVSEKVEIFENIVSPQLIDEMSKRKVNFDEKYRGTKIITVGRLSKEKGQDLAIEVLSMLRQEGYDVRWYCIGDGGELEEYRKIIEEKGLTDDFILLGAKTNPYPFMAKCDIYVQPSRHEGYCLSLAEAICLKKPIVTTDFIGAYDQIINNTTGLIVSSDVKDIFKAVKKLIENPILCQELIGNIAKRPFENKAEIKTI
jgi:glycosyltransferase involved in cell wall biosynthesis